MPSRPSTTTVAAPVAASTRWIDPGSVGRHHGHDEAATRRTPTRRSRRHPRSGRRDSASRRPPRGRRGSTAPSSRVPTTIALPSGETQQPRSCPCPRRALLQPPSSAGAQHRRELAVVVGRHEHGVVVGGPGDVTVGRRLVRVGQGACAHGTGHADRHRVGQQAEAVDGGGETVVRHDGLDDVAALVERDPLLAGGQVADDRRPCRRRCGGSWSRRARSPSRPGGCACGRGPRRAAAGRRGWPAVRGASRGPAARAACARRRPGRAPRRPHVRRAGSGRCIARAGRSAACGCRRARPRRAGGCRGRRCRPGRDRPRRCRRLSTRGCRGARAPGPGVGLSWRRT